MATSEWRMGVHVACARGAWARVRGTRQALRPPMHAPQPPPLVLAWHVATPARHVGLQAWRRASGAWVCMGCMLHVHGALGRGCAARGRLCARPCACTACRTASLPRRRHHATHVVRTTSGLRARTTRATTGRCHWRLSVGVGPSFGPTHSDLEVSSRVLNGGDTGRRAPTPATSSKLYDTWRCVHATHAPHPIITCDACWNSCTHRMHHV
jgi:hypothetical protein